MNKNLIEVKSQEEEWIRKTLKKRNDSEVKRLIRFLDYPDLSRDSGSPLFELVKRIREIKHFSDFDEIKVPEIVNLNPRQAQDITLISHGYKLSTKV